MLTAGEIVRVLCNAFEPRGSTVRRHQDGIDARIDELGQQEMRPEFAKHQARTEWLDQQMEGWKALRAALQNYKRELTAFSWRKVLEALDRVGKKDEAQPSVTEEK